MTEPRRIRRQTPGPSPRLQQDMPTNPVAQGLSMALFAAAQDNCNCRTCQILRKCLSEMTDQYLQGGE